MAHRLAPEAAADLDAIAYYIASETGDIGKAERLIAALVRRFLVLTRFPYIGRARNHDLGKGRRSTAVGHYVIIYHVDGGDVLILRVVHGRRDIEALFD
jgi:toxin ParE1/3/4